MSPHERLYALLREGREKAGLTQRAFAAMLDRPQSFVSRYETGASMVTVVDLIWLCGALGLDPRWVLDEVMKAATPRRSTTATS